MKKDFKAVGVRAINSNVYNVIKSISDEDLLSQIYTNNNGQLEFTWEGVTKSTDREAVKKLVVLVLGELKNRFKILGYKLIKEYYSVNINVYDIGHTSLIDLILEKQRR